MGTVMQESTMESPGISMLLTDDSSTIDGPFLSASSSSGTASVSSHHHLLPPQPSSGAGGAAASGPSPPSNHSASMTTSASGASLSGTGTEIRSSNTSTSDDRLPIITLEEVSWHDTHQDCWVVINDRVYDVTEFLFEHPGGEDVLLEHGGRDASFAFTGAGHSAAAVRALDRYLVGILPESERIFSTPSRSGVVNRKFGFFFL
ncbi:cytochrome b5 type B-like [Ischnura elegans]|uniref:cytochrome b5 type B-like n=1 Tax=Ischnura elegans TaxID=197161 RepID=UPI001ED8A2F5|nr:cytochrome b5 type B-like [Ischnura elegans]